jgi:hypothetical protein
MFSYSLAPPSQSFIPLSCRWQLSTRPLLRVELHGQSLNEAYADAALDLRSFTCRYVLMIAFITPRLQSSLRNFLYGCFQVWEAHQRSSRSVRSLLKPEVSDSRSTLSKLRASYVVNKYGSFRCGQLFSWIVQVKLNYPTASWAYNVVEFIT